MDLRYSNDDVMAIDIQEWELVDRLLAAMAPDEDGPYPGAQLSRHRAGRIWTLTNGAMTVDVRCDGSIPGLGDPVWMTARAVSFAVRTAEEDGPFCTVVIDDLRHDDGTVAALVGGDGCHARIDLPDRDPITTLRPPVQGSVLATMTTSVSALQRVVTAASLAPTGVPVSGPPAGTISVERDALVLTGADRRGVDRAAELRLQGEVRREFDPAIEVHLSVELAPLLSVVDQLPHGEVIVALNRPGELWLIAGPCRVVLRGEMRQLDPNAADGVIFLVGRVQGTDEAVLSLHGGCPVDDTIVWLESTPDDYGRLERIELRHDIVWYAEPEPYGVSTVDD